MREVFKEKEMEIMKLKEEGTALQQHSVLLGQQLEEARLELKVLVGLYWVLCFTLFFDGGLGVDCVLSHDMISRIKLCSYFAGTEGELCGEDRT